MLNSIYNPYTWLVIVCFCIDPKNTFVTTKDTAALKSDSKNRSDQSGKQNRISDSFAVDDIKCKFKNLRTVFNREYKAVQASRASDKLFLSKWKHYQQLLFLCESCDDDESPEEVQIVTPPEDRDPELGKPTASCALSGSAQTDGLGGPSPGEAKGGATYQLLLSASPERLLLANNQTAAPLACPSPSPPDTKPCTNQSPQNFSTSCPVPPDSRFIADNRCHWSEGKVQQLISFYSG